MDSLKALDPERPIREADINVADSVRAPIYKQRLASFAVADSTSHSNSWTEDARVKELVLFKERVLAGEGELAWDLRRSHSVPPALTDFDKVPRYTASRP